MISGGYRSDDPIVALATPWARSALAVIRTSGDGCIGLAGTVFSDPPRLARAAGHTLVHGYLVDPASGETADEVVAAVYRAPSSFTGQDSVELFCHGSLPGIEKILSILRRTGFRDAEPGEFTFRSFLSGKIDLTEAEAVNEIVHAKSRKAHSLAMNRLAGSVARLMETAKRRLTELSAECELHLDYPDDEFEEDAGDLSPKVSSVRQELAALAGTYETGRLYQQGLTVALAGKTNTGKSSLFNLFLKEDRSIVSEIHGTTRDYIESWIQVEGIPLLLIDTAGIREAEHPLEAEGIRRTGAVIESAGLIVYLVDSTAGPVPEDDDFIGKNADRVIPVWHKCDLGGDRCPAGYIPVSSLTGRGFDALEREIVKRTAGTAGRADTVIDSARQKALLDRAVAALDLVLEGLGSGVPLDAVSLDLREALDAIGEITGEVTTADILGTMFSSFCLGK